MQIEIDCRPGQIHSLSTGRVQDKTYLEIRQQQVCLSMAMILPMQKIPMLKVAKVPPGYNVIQYKDILTQFPAAVPVNGNIKIAGNTPRPSFVSAPGNYPYAQNIYLETPDTAVAKLNFLKSVGAQGAIIWEISNDVLGRQSKYKSTL